MALTTGWMASIVFRNVIGTTDGLDYPRAIAD